MANISTNIGFIYYSNKLVLFYSLKEYNDNCSTHATINNITLIFVKNDKLKIF